MSTRLALLGDSVAFGQGASAQADRPAARLTRSLTTHGVDADVRVFAVSGARSDGLHPCSAGYAVIADALLPEVLAAVLEAHRATPGGRSVREG